MKDDMRFAEDIVSPRRVAVLVDGENIPADHAGTLLALGQQHGPTTIRRVYGNAKILPKWDAAAGFRLIHSGTGKNATDMLLCIEAMQLAQEGGVGTFVIASSDRDFTHLAHHLRERGFTVMGLGSAAVQNTFGAACSAFTPLTRNAPGNEHAKAALSDTASPAANPTTTAAFRGGDVSAAASSVSDFDRKIMEVVASHGGGGNGMRIVDLNIAMQTRYQTVISAVAPGNWRGYLASKPQLYAVDAKGPDARVRLLAAGFKQKAKA